MNPLLLDGFLVRKDGLRAWRSGRISGFIPRFLLKDF